MYDLEVNILFVILFLNHPELICLSISIAIVLIHSNGSKYSYMKNYILFQLFVCTLMVSMVLNIAIQYHSYISTQLNGFKHCYVTLTIQFRSTVKEFHELLINTNNSIQHYSLVCSKLNCSKYCYVSVTIQLNISHLFTQSNGQKVLFLTIQYNISHLHKV